MIDESLKQHHLFMISQNGFNIYHSKLSFLTKCPDLQSWQGWRTLKYEFEQGT